MKSKPASRAEESDSYIPGMRFDLLLPLYDSVQKVFGVPAVHQLLIDNADIRQGQRILEIGCGTGNATLLVKRRHRDAEVTGIDPDQKALGRAGRKARNAGLSLNLDRGFAQHLPYQDGSFDRVLSALMLHHLDRPTKQRALREARRVLRHDGALYLVDFGGAKVRSDGLVARISHRSELLRDNHGDGIPALMLDAGFTEASEIDCVITKKLGRITCFVARSQKASRP